VLTAGTAAALLVWRGLPASSPALAPAAAADATPPNAAAPAATTKWMGVATCSAMGCHNANGPRRNPKGSEYSIWSAHDRHTKAYNVLFEDRSEQMVQNLYGKDAKAAHKTDLCLKCHAMNDGKEEALVGERFYIGDGVGCEGCHGAAENYLSEHYRAGFKELPAKEKYERFGLRNTKNLAARAKICVECHVGTPNKEVNHDLIAAGHPRLNFEFSGFLGIYPKHWVQLDDRGELADDPAQTWVAGQLACAAQSLHLLQSRAAAKNKPWPEFAEYNCYACHKDLQASSAHFQKGYGGQRPGAFPWGSWYLAELRPLAGQVGIDARRFAEAEKTVRGLMQFPDTGRGRVEQEAGELAGLLENALARIAPRKGPSFQDTNDLLDAILSDAKARGDIMSWDEAAQAFLAVQALSGKLATSPDTAPPAAVKEQLELLRNRLQGAFVKGFSSPRRFAPLAEPHLADIFETIRSNLSSKRGR
jgi:hypothetical protein